MTSFAMERYRRLSKISGITFVVCLIAFICFLVLTVMSSGEPQPCIGVADGVSSLASLAVGVVFIFAAVRIRVKSKAHQEECISGRSDSVSTTEMQSSEPPGSILTSEQRAGRAILVCVFAL